MANLKDIADRAGVNIATVSRFFNNRELVKTSTAQRIEAVVKQLGYKQRARRQGPRTPDRIGIRHFRIMIVCATRAPIEYYFRWASISRFFETILQEFQKLDISVECCSLGQDGTIPERLTRDYCDGVILFDEPEDELVRTKLHQALEDLPTVCTFIVDHDKESTFDLVRFDSSEIGRLAARYFSEHKVDRVVVFQEQIHITSSREQSDVFETECKRLGIKFHLIGLQKKDRELSMAERYKKLASDFLEIDGTSGLFFLSGADMMGILNELRACGVDISRYEYISAFAHAHTIRYFDKLAPMVDIKLPQLGILTAQRLLTRIRSCNKLPRTDIVISPELVYLDRVEQPHY